MYMNYFLCILITDVAEQVFYNCTTSNMSNPEHPDYEITFKYEYLDDMYSNWREKGTSSSNSSSGQ